MHDMKMLSPVKFINKKRRLHFACKDESGRPLFSSSSFQEPSAYLGKKSFVWTQEEKKFYPPTPSFSAEAAFMSVIYFILREVYFLKVKSKTSCLQDCNFVRSTVHLNTASTAETSLKKSFVRTQKEKKFYPPTPSFSAEAAFMSVISFIFILGLAIIIVDDFLTFQTLSGQILNFCIANRLSPVKYETCCFCHFLPSTISNLYNESPMV